MGIGAQSQKRYRLEWACRHSGSLSNMSTESCPFKVVQEGGIKITYAAKEANLSLSSMKLIIRTFFYPKHCRFRNQFGMDERFSFTDSA